MVFFNLQVIHDLRNYRRLQEKGILIVISIAPPNGTMVLTFGSCAFRRYSMGRVSICFSQRFSDAPDQPGPTHTSTPFVSYPAPLMLPTEVRHFQKTKKDAPTWYMVDVEFKSRAKHFVPLSVLKSIAVEDTQECLTSEDVDAIKGDLTCNRSCIHHL